MLIRMKVGYDNGVLQLEPGEETDALQPALAAKLVRVGLAEEVVAADSAGVAEGSALPGANEDGDQLGHLLKRELVAICEERGIAHESDDNKADLVAKIREAGNA